MKHQFQARTWDHVIVLSKWRCVNCGLKVRGRRVAEQLEGLECR